MARLSFHAEMVRSMDYAPNNCLWAIKDLLPRANIDGVAVAYDHYRMEYRVMFMRGAEKLGELRVEDAEDLLSEINLAKIMLMCG